MKSKPSKTRAGASSRNAKKPGRFPWASYTDEQLLDERICDLGVRLDGSQLHERVDQLYGELAEHQIRFRPHCWLSDEWFSPEGVPGIAIPFYLAHTRLMQLERAQMLEVEGGTDAWCMKILRHEAGHAIDAAYRLNRRRRYREMFGRSSQPYPEFYHPRPYSKRFVLHLDYWYAQSHPLEDFAETFAVWLMPDSPWRSQYQGWPAMRKLEYVDSLMQQINGTKPLVQSREHVESVAKIRRTLRQHYQIKRDHYGLNHPDFYDRDLKRLFSDDHRHRGNEAASTFLRRVRPELRRRVARATGQYQYTIDQVLRDMIERSRELKLRLDRPEVEAKLDAMVVLTVQTMNYLHAGHHRVAL